MMPHTERSLVMSNEFKNDDVFQALCDFENGDLYDGEVVELFQRIEDQELFKELLLEAPEYYKQTLAYLIAQGYVKTKA